VDRIGGQASDVAGNEESDDPSHTDESLAHGRASSQCFGG